MKTKLLLQFGVLLTVLLINTSEGFFLEYPKKVLTDFIYSLKEKKEAKKNPHEIRHYHVHYYPIPIYEPPTKAPEKYELESIHDEHLATLGWSKHEYKYVPEPKIKILSHLVNSWKDPIPWEHKASEIEFIDTVGHGLNGDIFLQLPSNKKIVVEYSGYDKELRGSLS